jgi:UDP-2,3-diacylglucosamine pyrophosphatase LpxH
MLRERGLNPQDWYIDAITVNEWEGMEASNVDADGKRYNNKQTLYQTKFTAKRKKPYAGLMPPRTDGWVAPKRNVAPSDEAELVVICGDQHAPFHDPHLHDVFQQWLAYNLPDRGVILGDLGDFPDISRHVSDPENQAFAQECLQSSYEITRDYVRASTDTYWDYLIGNHDARIRLYAINNAPLIYGLRTVDTDDSPGESVHSMAHLMRLDELGINLIEPHGSYEWAQVELSQNLAVRHGWLAQQGSGKTALATLQQTGYSVIVGHTHRQSMVFKSQPEIDGHQRTTLAAEAGCMCRIDPRGSFDDKGRRYPNYGAGHPDWQQGFVTATIWPDGKFHVDLATYVNGVLLYKEQRYE